MKLVTREEKEFLERSSNIKKATSVAAIGSTTNITAVPATFADVAAVRTYLADAGVVPNIEARLDALESKVNAVINALKAANLMA